MVRNADKETKLKDKKTPGKRKTLDKEKILRYDIKLKTDRKLWP